MRITSSIEYATRLAVALALRPKGEAVSAERLSESENIPVDYVNQILLKLKRAGLVSSRRGMGGGYELSKAPKDVRLGDILRAVEGYVFEDVCARFDRGKRDCHHQGSCAIASVWTKLGLLIEGYLDGVTLESLMEPAVVCQQQDKPVSLSTF